MTALLRRSRHLTLALAVAALGVTLAFATTTPAVAAESGTSPTERARSYYGAIAISVDARGGIANDRRTKAAAKRAAKAKCKRQSQYPGRCFTAVWVRNACGAVSVKLNSDGFVTRYGWAVRRYKGPAIRAAQQKCGSNCRKLAWVCTTRRF